MIEIMIIIFMLSMGGEAMKEMLSRISISELKNELVDIVENIKVKTKKE